MGCNQIPNFDKVDEAVNRRLRATPYESLFLTKEDYNNTEDKINKFLRDPLLAEPRFNEEYRIIFFDILKDYFLEWFRNGFSERPEKSKKIQNVVMASGDDLLGWFSNLYQKAEEELITAKSVLNRYSGSDFYMNLSKADKRNFNYSKFTEMIKENFHLKKYFKIDKNRGKMIFLGGILQILGKKMIKNRGRYYIFRGTNYYMPLFLFFLHKHSTKESGFIL